jgi:hypothetical protein
LICWGGRRSVYIGERLRSGPNQSSVSSLSSSSSCVTFPPKKTTRQQAGERCSHQRGEVREGVARVPHAHPGLHPLVVHEREHHRPSRPRAGAGPSVVAAARGRGGGGGRVGGGIGDGHFEAGDAALEDLNTIEQMGEGGLVLICWLVSLSSHRSIPPHLIPSHPIPSHPSTKSSPLSTHLGPGDAGPVPPLAPTATTTAGGREGQEMLQAGEERAEGGRDDGAHPVEIPHAHLLVVIVVMD